jgi:ferric-dicitrate binding protein FerR (iron transport regulator)
MLAQEEKGSEEDETHPWKQPVRQEEESKESLADLPKQDTEEPEKSVVKKTSPTPSEKKLAAAAKVGSLVGEFRVKRKGSTDWLEGKALLSILPGDTMETNALGRVRVDFDGGDYVYVNTNSRVDFAGSGEETLVEVSKGEVYCEKESLEGELAVKTGSGEVRSKKGRFSVKMFGESQCLLQVLSGEVECCESEKGHTGKHGELTRMWLRRGKRCDKGTKLRSKEDFRWVVKLQPKSDEDAGKQAGKAGKQDKPGKHGPGLPPGTVPKPGGEPGQEPGGKVGPGPSPIPPPPGGSGPGPGNGHGPGGNPGGKK